jgi:hypothetical protein
VQIAPISGPSPLTATAPRPRETPERVEPAALTTGENLLTKSDRDLVLQRTGQRIDPTDTPVPLIALQIAAERRSGVSSSPHNQYTGEIAYGGDRNAAQDLLRAQQASHTGLDVTA